MFLPINQSEMIFLKTDDEIELLRQSNLLVGKTLAEVAKLIRPGVTTLELDKVAEEFIRDNGAIPTFKGYPSPYGEPFPGTLCTSVNEQVVHGIPNNIPLKDGDIVSVDYSYSYISNITNNTYNEDGKLTNVMTSVTTANVSEAYTMLT